MFSSRLFWKLFAVYAVLVLGSAGGLVAVLSGRQRELVEGQIERRLRDTAVLLRSHTAAEFEATSPQTADLQSLLRDLAAQTGSRLTLVRADGAVLADSAEDPRMMRNHSDRNEIREALHAGVGTARRPSPTLGIPMSYYALRVGPAGRPVGVVRVAMDAEDVERQVLTVRRLVWGTAIGTGLAALVLSGLLVARISRPLVTLTQAAEAIAAGELRQNVEVPGRDELGRLAVAFNAMSRELASRIDELQEQGRQARQNSERLETVLAGMVEGVVAVDSGERILFANRAARRTLDLGKSTCIGRPVWEVIRHPTVQATVRELLEGREQVSLELDLPRRQAVASLIATRLPGEPCPGVVLVFHDITELRRLENLRRDFVSNVSHELKTPLTAIQALTETLLAGAIDDPGHNRQFLERIEEHGERLHHLILDLLQLARIESDEDLFELRPVPVGATIESCVREHAAVADAKGVQLSAEPPLGDDLQILADPEGLRTILDNLVDNALQHTPSGGRVTVRWGRDGLSVAMAVEDTGVGIPRQHLSRIFERFYRADKARSRERGGTGLGLAIVKHLVQVFGGEVDVESRVGQGSTFLVRLPLIGPRAQAAPEQSFTSVEPARS
ncbi:MAG TPA: ATP-binding protein [Planctomycetaceae bacterium]|nr:ATP-binding protein [Planctomycetaceae bacterium]